MRVVVAVPAAQVGHRGADGRHVVGVQGQVQVQAQAGVRVVCGRREPAAVDDGAHPRQLRRPAGAIGERAAQRRRALETGGVHRQQVEPEGLVDRGLGLGSRHGSGVLLCGRRV